VAVKTLKSERAKRISINAKVARFTVVATVLLAVGAVAVEIVSPPSIWKHTESVFEQDSSGAVLLSFFLAPLILFFLIPFILGARSIRPIRTRVELEQESVQEAADSVAERMVALGLSVEKQEDGDALRLTGKSSLRPLHPNPGKNRAREIVVEIRRKVDMVMADASFHYLGTDAVGVDTGEGEYAADALTFALRGGDEPKDPFLKGWAWVSFTYTACMLVGVLLCRADILPGNTAMGVLFIGGCFTLGSLIHALYCGLKERSWGSPYIACTLVIVATAAAIYLRSALF